MKITLYAEACGNNLFALPCKSAADTVDNGWLFPHLGGKDCTLSNEILNAEFTDNGLFITPLSFGTTVLHLSHGELEIEILPVINNGSYRYKNLPIGGGGYVTGFSFDEDGWLFCRTDIGGCYSCSPSHITWHALSHNADISTEWLCNPLALTCKNGKLYVLFGNHLGSFVGVSSDKGQSFDYSPIPVHAHGNCSGRSTGERIAVTSDKIFVGTRGDGLLCAALSDKVFQWKKIPLPTLQGEKLLRFSGHGKKPAEISPNNDITFVRAVSDDIIIVGTAADQGVLVSCNGGQSFQQLPEQPCRNNHNKTFISQRCAVFKDNLFITYSCSYADKNSPWFSYACDGSRLFDGKILRYCLSDGRYVLYDDITPPAQNCGFSGIDISGDGRHLVCTTVCGNPDSIFLSRNMGTNWEEVLSDPKRAVQNFHTPYLRHENNNNRSVIHWMSDIKIDPNNGNCAYINTGTGVFRTQTLGAELTVWNDFCGGIEETVHLNIYSPPKGNVRVIDVVGDLGGFSFTDIDKECDFTFRDENNNRYVTAMNADFAEKCPEIAVCSPRGNWIGTSKGGAAISFDGGINWRQLSNPIGMNSHADSLLERISHPNVNPGWVAVSCDGRTIIRQIADVRQLPADCIAVTSDLGKSWSQVRFYNNCGGDITDSGLCVKIFSDRHFENVFYAFGNHGQVFLSRDSGLSFTLTDVCGKLPSADFSSIEGNSSSDIRVSPIKSGEILICFASHGLFTLKLSGDSFIAERFIPAEDCSCALCAGYGKGGVVFFCGIYKGVYGFYRLLGSEWIRINSDAAQFGQIRSVCGDPRAYGRFYIATGTFGAIYGEIDV